eukprot:3362529-Prymnesium_polylepis.1
MPFNRFLSAIAARTNSEPAVPHKRGEGERARTPKYRVRFAQQVASAAASPPLSTLSPHSPPARLHRRRTVRPSVPPPRSVMRLEIRRTDADSRSTSHAKAAAVAPPPSSTPTQHSAHHSSSQGAPTAQLAKRCAGTRRLCPLPVRYQGLGARAARARRATPPCPLPAHVALHEAPMLPLPLSPPTPATAASAARPLTVHALTRPRQGSL